MRILSRYILRHFFPIFALSLLAFVGLYLIIDFFEKVDDLLEKQVPFTDSFAYFLYKIPFIATQGTPMAVLLASLIALGLLKRNHELIALEAAGVRAASYVMPMVISALLLALVHFATAETIVRSLNQKAQGIWQERVLGHSPSLAWRQENVWYHGKDIIYQIRLYDRARQTLEKVSLFYLDPQFKLIQRLDARRLRWEAPQWVAEEGLILRFIGATTEQEWFERRALDLPVSPKDFAGLETMPEALNWLHLYGYTQKIRQEGYNAIPYEVELHLRVAFPLTTLILTLLGITIALRQGIHGGMALGVGIALLVAFLYLTVLQVGSALATAAILSPVVGVWAADVIFAALAGYLWITQSQ